MLRKAIATLALAAVTALTVACAVESPPDINATATAVNATVAARLEATQSAYAAINATAEARVVAAEATIETKVAEAATATAAPTPTVMLTSTPSPTPTPSLTPADKARWVEIAEQMFYCLDNNPQRRDDLIDGFVSTIAADGYSPDAAREWVERWFNDKDEFVHLFSGTLSRRMLPPDEFPVTFGVLWSGFCDEPFPIGLINENP